MSVHERGTAGWRGEEWENETVLINTSIPINNSNNNSRKISESRVRGTPSFISAHRVYLTTRRQKVSDWRIGWNTYRRKQTSLKVAAPRTRTSSSSGVYSSQPTSIVNWSSEYDCAKLPETMIITILCEE